MELGTHPPQILHGTTGEQTCPGLRRWRQPPTPAQSSAELTDLMQSRWVVRSPPPIFGFRIRVTRFPPPVLRPSFWRAIMVRRFLKFGLRLEKRQISARTSRYKM